MTELETLRPTRHLRLMDLVSEAGIDTSEWSKFSRGASWAATNPRFCYEWSFVERNKLVVLNIWHDGIRQLGKKLIYEANFRVSARTHARRTTGGNPIWKVRARRFDEAVELAATTGLPIRVVICDGNRRRESESVASKVKTRLLDPVPWGATSYDTTSGAFVLTRGALRHRLVDQFSEDSHADSPTEMRSATGMVFVRDARIRMTVLARANGICEWCKLPGFVTLAGDMFLETHHVVPLSKGGADTTSNVVALCPNHHREAHFGAARTNMQKQLLKIASRKSSKRMSM